MIQGSTRIDETERQRALDALHIVGSLPEPAYDDIVKVAAAVCGTPMALVTLIDRDRQWFKARTGLDGIQTERNVAVLQALARLTMTLMESRSRERDQQVAAIIDHAGAGESSTVADGAGAFTVVILELQDLSALAQRLGERGLDRQLQQLDQVLERCLQPDRGDSINRVTGSGEFVAMLGSGDASETVAKFDQVARDLSQSIGAALLLGTASTQIAEPATTVFLRADQALSAAKDVAARQ